MVKISLGIDIENTTNIYNFTMCNSIAMQMFKWIQMHVVLGVAWDTNYKYIRSNLLRTSEDRGKVNHLKLYM